MPVACSSSSHLFVLRNHFSSQPCQFSSITWWNLFTEIRFREINDYILTRAGSTWSRTIVTDYISKGPNRGSPQSLLTFLCRYFQALLLFFSYKVAPEMWEGFTTKDNTRGHHSRSLAGFIISHCESIISGLIPPFCLVNLPFITFSTSVCLHVSPHLSSLCLMLYRATLPFLS